MLDTVQIENMPIDKAVKIIKTLDSDQRPTSYDQQTKIPPPTSRPTHHRLPRRRNPTTTARPRPG